MYAIQAKKTTISLLLLESSVVLNVLWVLGEMKEIDPFYRRSISVNNECLTKAKLYFTSGLLCPT